MFHDLNQRLTLLTTPYDAVMFNGVIGAGGGGGGKPDTAPARKNRSVEQFFRKHRPSDGSNVNVWHCELAWHPSQHSATVLALNLPNVQLGGPATVPLARSKPQLSSSALKVSGINRASNKLIMGT